MSADPFISGGIAALTAALGYFFGGRAAGMKAAHEQRLRSVNNLVILIGRAITELRAEQRYEHADEIEDNELRFKYSDFLAQIRAVFDSERPYLPAQASNSVDTLIKKVRRHAQIKGYLAAGDVTETEVSSSGWLADLIEACEKTQDELVKSR